MIWERFVRQVAVAPLHDALKYNADVWSYEAVARAASAVGDALGVSRPAHPARVLVRHADPRVVIERVFGCWSRGFVPVVLRNGTTEPQVRACRERLNPVAVLIDDVTDCVASRAAVGHGGRTTWRPTFDVRDEALVLATSGSTGTARFVALPAESVLVNSTTIGRELDFTASDRLALTTPLGYSYGLMGVAVAGLMAGATLVLYPTHEPLMRALSVIRRERVTVVQGPPSMLRVLLAAWRGEPFDSVRLVTTGGELLPKGLAELLDRAFPAARKVFLYGMTEAGPRIAHEPVEAGGGVEGCIGRPFPHVEWRLDPVDGGADGEGRLRLRGPSLFLGYVGPDGQYEGLDAAGFLVTNDLLAVRSDGRLAFRGRIDRVFKSGGRLVNPQAVETLLMRHPGVNDAHCFPEEHPLLGLVPVAEVIFAQAADVDVTSVSEFCARFLEPHEVPRRISRVTDWALNESGKRTIRSSGRPPA